MTVSSQYSVSEATSVCFILLAFKYEYSEPFIKINNYLFKFLLVITAEFISYRCLHGHNVHVSILGHADVEYGGFSP